MKQRNTLQVKGDLPKKEGLYLYQITNNFDNMIYIGQTNNPYSRKGKHNASGGTGTSQKAAHMYNSMRKHGRANFTYEVLQKSTNPYHLDQVETDLIAYYKAKGLSYNNAEGGSVNRGWKQSEETKAKISASMQGENNSMYGRTGENHHMYGKTGDTAPNYKYPPELISTFPNQPAATEATGISRSQYYNLKEANPNLPWPEVGGIKYPPEEICKYPNQKAATEATGISPGSYSRLRRTNPNLPWPLKGKSK
jgi:group I intron endonuclease